MDKLLALKIGGSILSKSEEIPFDFDYAFQLRQMLRDMGADGYKFLLNVGGGHVARKYQHLASENGEKDEMDVHRVGIAATNLNCEILHGLFDDLALPEIVRYHRFDDFLNQQNPEIHFEVHDIMMVSPSKPGSSNDLNLVEAALKMGIKRVVSAKNVDGVYTADPKLTPGSKRIDNLTWDEYLDVIGNPIKHEPGASYPVDPITSRRSKEAGIEFVIVDGADLVNLHQALAGKSFTGSTIRN